MLFAGRWKYRIVLGWFGSVGSAGFRIFEPPSPKILSIWCFSIFPSSLKYAAWSTSSRRYSFKVITRTSSWGLASGFSGKEMWGARSGILSHSLTFPNILLSFVIRLAITSSGKGLVGACFFSRSLSSLNFWGTVLRASPLRSLACSFHSRLYVWRACMAVRSPKSPWSFALMWSRRCSSSSIRALSPELSPLYLPLASIPAPKEGTLSNDFVN